MAAARYHRRVAGRAAEDAFCMGKCPQWVGVLSYATAHASASTSGYVILGQSGHAQIQFVDIVKTRNHCSDAWCKTRARCSGNFTDRFWTQTTITVSEPGSAIGSDLLLDTSRVHVRALAQNLRRPFTTAWYQPQDGLRTRLVRYIVVVYVVRTQLPRIS